MFDALRIKASNLGQKMLVKMGQAEEFKEDEDFTTRIANFKATRLALMDIVEKGKKLLEAMNAATAAKLVFV